MNPDTLNGIHVRVTELERVKERDEATHERMWEAISHDRLDRARFEVKVEERQRELRNDIAELGQRIGGLATTIESNEKARDDREEKRTQGTLKSKLAYVGAAALVLASLIGAIAQIVGHP